MIRAKLIDRFGIFEDAFIEDLPFAPPVGSTVADDFVLLQESLNDNEKEKFLEFYKKYDNTMLSYVELNKDEKGYYLCLYIIFINDKPEWKNEN